MKRMLLLHAITSLVLLATARTLTADDVLAEAADRLAKSGNQPPPIRLTLPLAAPPAAALKYKLTPSLVDRRPGNAAVLYNKIGLSHTGKAADETQTKLSDWLELPLDKLPKEEVRTALATYKQVLDDLDLAARRDHCDWQFPLHERNLFMLLLPELQKCREYGRLVAMQARLQILDGQFDAAIRSLQTGFAMSRHVSEGPTLINGLVGLAMCEMMLRRAEELIERADKINLYWALTALPRPILDRREAIESEMDVLYLSYPILNNLRTASHSTQEWQNSLQHMINELGMMTDSKGWHDRLGLTVLALRGYSQAKQRLLDEGRTAGEIEAMPVFQVVMIDSMETYEELRDRMMRWLYVPYWQAEPRFDAEEEYLMTEGRRREIFPLATMLIPAVRKASFAYARTDRHVAALRVVEAVRTHAAANDGKLPASLDEITEVPVPEDPVTGKSFEYTTTGGAVSLKSPKSAARDDQGLRYEIEFRK